MKTEVGQLQQTEQDLQTRILEFAGKGGRLNRMQRRRIRLACLVGNDEVKAQVARMLLCKIHKSKTADVGLAEDLKEYAPDISARVILVSALLFEGLERALLATQPIPIATLQGVAA